MNQPLTLKVEGREKVSTKVIESKRKEGLVPGVLYSHGQPAVSFWVPYIDFSKMYKIAGQSSVVAIEGVEKKTVNAIIQDVSLHPLNGRFTHVDLYQVRMDEKLEAHVPLVFVGESKAVREMGGVFLQTLEEVLVTCLPADLPHEITIDIASLATFDDRIQVKDIVLPKGVEVLGDPETTVALVDAPRSEAEMASLDEKATADVTKVEGVVKEDTPVT
jgi:large subunit ribosomal protein L25